MPKARCGRRSFFSAASIRGCTLTPPSSPTSSPTKTAAPRKKIILKGQRLSLGRGAGAVFGETRLWVSEYRIESGLNCGGHAFATQGLLLGPILEEFKRKNRNSSSQLFAIYVKALGSAVRPCPRTAARPAYGARGIGSAAEDALLRDYYAADGTGWATPFLLVPEVTNVDREHLEKLCRATEADVYLSDSSPFGMPFWNLRTSSSEETRRKRIAEGRPGSRCVKDS